jgi:hypothetical protein
MSDPVLELLIFYGGLGLFGAFALGYGLLVYRRGRRKVSVSVSDFEAANARAKLTGSRFPSVKMAWYDGEKGRVVVELEAGLQLSFPAKGVPGLGDVSPQDLGEIVVRPSGLGLHFPTIDADVYLPSLLERHAAPTA